MDTRTHRKRWQNLYNRHTTEKSTFLEGRKVPFWNRVNCNNHQNTNSSVTGHTRVLPRGIDSAVVRKRPIMCVISTLGVGTPCFLVAHAFLESFLWILHSCVFNACSLFVATLKHTQLTISISTSSITLFKASGEYFCVCGFEPKLRALPRVGCTRRWLKQSVTLSWFCSHHVLKHSKLVFCGNWFYLILVSTAPRRVKINSMFFFFFFWRKITN